LNLKQQADLSEGSTRIKAAKEQPYSQVSHKDDGNSTNSQVNQAAVVVHDRQDYHSFERDAGGGT
jgi:hypothetical protein